MPAWAVSGQWTGTQVEGYRNYAADRVRTMFTAQEPIDCADLCLKILVEFAKGARLPLRIEAETGPGSGPLAPRADLGGPVGPAMGRPRYELFDPSMMRWRDWRSFQTAVLAGVEANEIAGGGGANYGNTCRINIGDLKPGDMLAHLSRAPIGPRHGTYGHIQLVVSSNLRSARQAGPPSGGSALVYQGNLERRHWYSGNEAVPIQRGRYNFRGGVLRYKRDQKPEEDFTASWARYRVIPIRWNFNQFNSVATASCR